MYINRMVENELDIVTVGTHLEVADMQENDHGELQLCRGLLEISSSNSVDN